LKRITGYKDLAIQGLKKHVYDNSLDAVNEQVSRDTDKYKECRLDLHPQCSSYKRF
jgi:thymidylate synthase